jgi:hypothetical protein
VQLQLPLPISSLGCLICHFQASYIVSTTMTDTEMNGHSSDNAAVAAALSSLGSIEREFAAVELEYCMLHPNDHVLLFDHLLTA